MLCTHVGLYSYLPLSLNGPKGEGIKGARVPRWGWGGVPPTVTRAVQTHIPSSNRLYKQRWAC